ncbi:hypothetical protein AB0H37_14225 [Actinomadura sp. NPDC023710]|uniref:hypothetical protein n=1 Tax=Actinomadura sp. NPDC023710 TaxID=3158219 RepID=UPI0033EC753C
MDKVTGLQLHLVKQVGNGSQTCSLAAGGVQSGCMLSQQMRLVWLVHPGASSSETNWMLAFHTTDGHAGRLERPGVQRPGNAKSCTMLTRPPEQSKRLPVAGLKRLARLSGTADGRSGTVLLKGPGKSTRMRLTCVDDAAVAVVRLGGRANLFDCESAESTGIVWDLDAGRGTHGIEIAVLPAEAGKVHGTGDAALAKLRKGVKPAGKWTLEVYAR